MEEYVVITDKIEESVNSTYETFESLLNMGIDFDEVYKIAKEMVPRGCKSMLEALIFGN